MSDLETLVQTALTSYIPFKVNRFTEKGLQKVTFASVTKDLANKFKEALFFDGEDTSELTDQLLWLALSIPQPERKEFYSLIRKDPGAVGVEVLSQLEQQLDEVTQ